jgi:lipopolysaccharide export system protein LptA
MALDPRQHRKWFLYAAVAILLIVAGFYGYARYRSLHYSQTHGLPARLDNGVESSSQGYTFSKSDHGRTLFTIHAAKAVQFKEGGRAELRDVNVVVYGKGSDRFDQIYGSVFDYDPVSGDIVAKDDVQIDLENNLPGRSSPDQAPPQVLKNVVHIKTRGLTFNQKTGNAVTHELIEFHLPQASGTAVGATLDSKTNTLTLDSQINITTTGPNPANIVGQHAILTKQPRQAVLEKAHLTSKQDTLDSDKVTVFLRDDNTVDHVLAEGNVHVAGANTTGEKYDVHAAQGNLVMGEHNVMQTAVLQQNVTLDSTGGGPGGAQPVHASAGTAVIDFAADRHPRKIHATEDVHFRQDQAAKAGKAAQQIELISDGVDILSGAKGVFQSAVTSGAARIEIQQAATRPSAPPVKTVVTAGQFNAAFDPQGRMKTLHGEPDAKIVSPNPTPNLPDRVSTSQTLDVVFKSKANDNGIESIVQQGNVHYSDDERQAFSDHARYTPEDQMLNLTGSPRVTDNDKNGAKMQTTAVSMRLNRGTGDAFADNEVKTTYNNLKPQPSGAMLSSGDPIHVTARHMAATKATGIAHYSGDVRLWQGASVVEAPAIDFQREHRSMTAQGSGSSLVKSVFVQNDSHGKQSPVHVTSSRLTYTDEERKARFEGNVFMTSSDATIKADRMDIYLTKGEAAKGAPAPAAAAEMPSQIDHAVAEGNVFVQQPARTGQGEKLVYTAGDSKYVLTGTSAKPPSLFDAQRGTVTGDSVTFYSQEDRVLVESSSSVRAVTQTRVK